MSDPIDNLKQMMVDECPLSNTCEGNIEMRDGTYAQGIICLKGYKDCEKYKEAI